MRINFKRLLGASVLAAATFATSVAADAAALKVTNYSDQPIALVYISPSWSSTYRDADQQLGRDQYIMPGDTWVLRFAGGDTCYFDLEAVFLDFTKTERTHANLCGGDMTWTVGS